MSAQGTRRRAKDVAVRATVDTRRLEMGPALPVVLEGHAALGARRRATCKNGHFKKGYVT